MHKQVYNKKRWEKIRRRILTEHPLCFFCERNGITRLATEVDHMLTFSSVDDPLAFEYFNMQPICTECHRRLSVLEKAIQPQLRQRWSIDMLDSEEARVRLSEAKHKLFEGYARTEFGVDGYPVRKVSK